MSGVVKKAAPQPQPWGCAAIAGVSVGLAVAMHLNDTSFRRPVVVIGSFAVLAIWLARRYGDAFWKGIVALADILF
jgi:hypothetical protein